MTDTPPHLIAPSLAHPRLSHGFFGRQGGVSTGLYATLNCSIGATADVVNAQKNRNRAQAALGAATLLLPYQIHSAKVAMVSAPSGMDARPEADALVTNLPSIALGVLTADCAPILFADPVAGIIGAAHAGWKGALAGILHNTIDAMLTLGATLPNIRAVIGPAIQQASYEVGDDLRQRFLAQYATNDRFFARNANQKFQFDLPGYVAAQLTACGLCHIETLGIDTYADETRWFSYRRATHRANPDYGRQLSAIYLKSA